MFIPLRTDCRLRRRTLVTPTIIILNLLVYLLGLVAETTGLFNRGDLLHLGQLSRHDFQPWQLLTYQFLHDPNDLLHLGFNMLFLWVFGAAVEDRLHRTSFLAFYLLGGAIAGIGHLIISPNPVIGASGSVSAVTGAFLALFPRSRIQILFWFFIIGIYAIPSLWFIGFYFCLDLLNQTMNLLGGTKGNVAYAAHLAGSLFGFTLAFTLIAVGVVKRSHEDVFYLFKQSRRRAAFRAASRSQTGGLYESASADTGRKLEKQAAKSKPAEAKPLPHADARAEISHLIADHDLPTAARRYRDLLQIDPTVTFPESRQLDLANQLHADQDHPTAALAYELFLKRYPAARTADEVRLLLALTCIRHLNEPHRARSLLDSTLPRVTDPAHKALADQLRTELEAAP